VKRPPIYFVAHHLRRRWPELDHETASMPLAEVPPSRWMPLENIWIVSTYLRLRAAGQDVRIVDGPVAGAINICCDERAGVSSDSSEAFLVFTQGDRERMPWADYRLVQSPAQLRGSRVTLMRHWPQPGLIPRNASRGTRLERLGYVGPIVNLDAAFRSSDFRNALGTLGVELVIRDDPAHWRDFSDLDSVVAVRPWPFYVIRTKPATKLVHAWLTGVPALLGPEPSYRYWGTDGEDYFEVRSPDEAVAVVKRLKDEPALYEQVWQRGLQKGREHDEQAVLRQWIEVLDGPLADAYGEWRNMAPRIRLARRIARPIRRHLWRVNHGVFRLALLPSRVHQARASTASADI